MAAELDLTTWTEPRHWPSTGTRLQQSTEALELQFKYGLGGSATYKTSTRFCPNGDLRLFGELVIEGGQIRAYSTMAMTVYGSSAEDIVSFRNYESTTGQNTERLRITSTGALQAASIVFKADDSGTSTQWGTLDFDSGTRRLNATDGSTEKALEIVAHSLTFYADDGIASTEWGTLDFDSSTRRLHATDGSSDQVLEILADSIAFTVGGSNTVQVTSDGDVYADGVVGTYSFTSGSPPSGKQVGAMALDDTNDKLYVYTSSGWLSATLS